MRETSSKKKIEHHGPERYRQRPFSSGLGRRMPVMNYAGDVMYAVPQARRRPGTHGCKSAVPFAMRARDP